MSSKAATPFTEIMNSTGGVCCKSLASEFVNVTNPAAGELSGHISISPEADVGGLSPGLFAGMADERDCRRELGTTPRGIAMVLAVSADHQVVAIGTVQAEHIHKDRAFCGVNDLPES